MAASTRRRLRLLPRWGIRDGRDHRIEVVLAIQLTMVTLALNRIAMFNKKQDLS